METSIDIQLYKGNVEEYLKQLPPVYENVIRLQRVTGKQLNQLRENLNKEGKNVPPSIDKAHKENFILKLKIPTISEIDHKKQFNKILKRNGYNLLLSSEIYNKIVNEKISLFAQNNKNEYPDGKGVN